MHVFVKMLSSKTYTFKTKPSATVRSLLESINERERYAVHWYRLIYGGKQLRDDRFLSDYDVQEGSTLPLVLRLSGGT